ncbi:MAG: phage portal protein [Anaerolineae bacterium]|nr:phage portal protein [Anaerolineae bacterium]
MILVKDVMAFFRLPPRRPPPAHPADPLPFDAPAPLAQDSIPAASTGLRHPQADEPPLYFFDGKALTPLGQRQDTPGFFTGMGPFALSTRRKLQHTDYDYALAATQCEYAFRCVNIIADDLAGIPNSVHHRRSQQPMPEHPLMQAFAWARLEYFQNIIRLWEAGRMIFGEVYIEPCKNAFGFYNGMRWLNPLATDPIIINGRLERFEYTPDSGLYHFRPDEIVYDRFDWILDDIRGQSLIAAALDAINIDREVKRYTLESFLKDMRMQGILTGRQGSNIQQHELDAALATIEQKKEKRLIALSPALEYTPVQHAWDGSQLQVSDDVRRRITAALGIPMSTAGAWDDAKYQSAPEQRRHYLENVVLRETNRHARFVNEVLLPFFDPWGEAVFSYDTSELMGLIEDKAAKVSLYNSRVQASNATLNEARIAAGDQPLPGGDVLLIPSGMVAVPVEQLATFAQQQAQAAAAPAMPTSALAETVGQPAALPDADKTSEAAPPMGKSGCLLLTLPNQPDLIALQGSVRRLVGDVPCEWHDPAQFHITLVYLPTITDAQAAALVQELSSIEVSDMQLRVGSLAVFDTLGQHALHFKVRRDEGLYDLQADLYDLCAELGIPTSSYSQPERYDPHITMGDASQPFPRTTYRGKLKVRPAALQFTMGETVVFQQALGAPTQDAAQPAKEESPTFQQQTLDELSAWQKKASNKGAQKAVSFQHYCIRDEIAEGIRAALAEVGDDWKPIFERARQLLNYKTLISTQADFENAFAALLDDARAGALNKRAFSASLRTLLNRYGQRAYADGLSDGGIDDELDEDDRAAVAMLLAEQSRYVSRLADVLYADDNTLTDAIAEQKPTLWFNKSITPFYTEGLLAADKNGLYEWQYGATEHCADCKRLHGQRHRLRDWAKHGLLPQSSALACGGFNCECKLIRVSGKARGRW